MGATQDPTPPLFGPIRTEHITMIAHYYRGEIQRSNMWRQRLDATTNWAIMTTMGMMGVCFTYSVTAHPIFLLTNLTLALFLWIEARRYRYFDVWRARTRMMEAHLIAPMFLPDHPWLQGDWRKRLAEDLLLPSFKMPLRGAIAVRFRRNYVWLFLLVLLAWVARIGMSQPAQGWSRWQDAFSTGMLGGEVVATVAGAFYASLVVFTLFSMRWKEREGPVHKRVAGTGDDWLT